LPFSRVVDLLVTLLLGIKCAKNKTGQQMIKANGSNGLINNLG
jgi:hypothetical protein